MPVVVVVAAPAVTVDVVTVELLDLCVEGAVDVATDAVVDLS